MSGCARDSFLAAQGVVPEILYMQEVQMGSCFIVRGSKQQCKISVMEYLDFLKQGSWQLYKIKIKAFLKCEFFLTWCLGYFKIFFIDSLKGSN